MREFLTEAIVLSNDPGRGFDGRVHLYTEKLGKISARVSGGKKILSKLSPHLDPLNLSLVRLVKKGGITLVDTLTLDRFTAVRNNLGSLASALDVLALLKSSVAE